MTDPDEIRDAIAAGMLPFVVCEDCKKRRLCQHWKPRQKWLCADCIPTKAQHLEDDGRVIRSTRGLN